MFQFNPSALIQCVSHLVHQRQRDKNAPLPPQPSSASAMSHAEFSLVCYALILVQCNGALMFSPSLSCWWNSFTGHDVQHQCSGPEVKPLKPTKLWPFHWQLPNFTNNATVVEPPHWVSGAANHWRVQSSFSWLLFSLGIKLETAFKTFSPFCLWTRKESGSYWRRMCSIISWPQVWKLLQNINSLTLWGLGRIL